PDDLVVLRGQVDVHEEVPREERRRLPEPDRREEALGLDDARHEDGDPPEAERADGVILAIRLRAGHEPRTCAGSDVGHGGHDGAGTSASCMPRRTLETRGKWPSGSRPALQRCDTVAAPQGLETYTADRAVRPDTRAPQGAVRYARCDV